MAPAAPVMPPPPALLPGPTCPVDRWEAQQRAAAPSRNEPIFGGSYRERLRAGGQHAFQRAFDVGLMPKNMRQECSDVYSGQGDQMWNGMGQMQANDYCGAPMQSHYQQVPMEHMMSMPPQQMYPGAGPIFEPPQPMQPMLPQMPPMQMVPLMQAEQSPHMAQMPQPAMQALTPTASSSYGSTPTEMDSVRAECMAIVMPQDSPFFPVDKDLLALQLKASAELCNCYED